MATVNETEFSDIYIIPDGTAYIWGRKTPSGLIPVSYTHLTLPTKA